MVAVVLVVCLLVIVCGCGGLLLHRNGFLTRKFTGLQTNIHPLPSMTD